MTVKTHARRCRMESIALYCFVVVALLAKSTALWAGEPNRKPGYTNRLTPIVKPPPLLADTPEFLEPIRETARYEAPALIDEKNATLNVRSWRFSYNARGIIEMPNRLQGGKTAVIVVHPWGIDDSQGWKSPEPAGVAFFCTPEKNRIYHKHVRQVVNPFVQAMRDRVALTMYSLPGSEDAIRKKMYRSFRSRPTDDERAQGARELKAKLNGFAYRGGELPAQMPLAGKRAEAVDYFAQFPGLDAGDKYNSAGFWDLPIPVVSDLKVDADDVVIYDADGYDALRTFLKKKGIRHILLAGYATDMCVCETTAGYKNLSKDFNVFLVGDVTMATFPAAPTPRFATNASISFASLNLMITQVSWIRAEQKLVGSKIGDGVTR